MPIIAWNKTMETGVPSIDAEHQKLVQLVNQLFDAVSQGKAKDALAKVLDELVSYTVNHFAHEEREFTKTAYPDQAAHLKEHKDLTAQVVAFKQKLAAGQAAINADLLTFLRNWLTNHIMTSDMKYAKHFIAKGVR